MFRGVCKGGSGGFPACPCTFFLPQVLLLHLRYNISIFHDPSLNPAPCQNPRSVLTLSKYVLSEVCGSEKFPYSGSLSVT